VEGYTDVLQADALAVTEAVRAVPVAGGCARLTLPQQTPEAFRPRSTADIAVDVCCRRHANAVTVSHNHNKLQVEGTTVAAALLVVAREGALRGGEAEFGRLPRSDWRTVAFSAFLPLCLEDSRAPPPHISAPIPPLALRPSIELLSYTLPP
jgi:hypothetical protein